MMKISRTISALNGIGLVLLFASLSFASDLLVSSFGSGAVLRYDGETGAFLGEFVPSGSGGLSSPSGLVFGPDGHLYVSNSPPVGSGGVIRYDGETGAFLDEFVDDGVMFPNGLAFGSDGHLYLANGNVFSGSVNRYDGQTGDFIDAFVPPLSGLGDPHGLIFGPDGNLYVSSTLPGNVRRYDGQTGALIDVFANVAAPVGIVFGPDGDLYVSNSSTDAVIRFDGQTGAFVSEFVAAGSGGLDGPHGLVFGADGNLYVSSEGTASILRYDGATGAFIDVFVSTGSGGLSFPAFLTFLPTTPTCTIEMSQDVYLVNDTVSADSWRLTNPGQGSAAVEMKAWLGVPGSSPVSIVNAGADGSLVFPAGLDAEFGPVDLFVVLNGFPLGTYEFSCRLLDPVTGETMSEDLNFFEVQ